MKIIRHTLALALALFAAACSSFGPAAELRSEMQGAWGDESGTVQLLIEGNRCVQAQDHGQQLFDLRFIAGQALRTQIYLGQPVPGGLEFDGTQLLLKDPVEGRELHFTRLESLPESVITEPYGLGSAPLSSTQLNSISRKLLGREAHSKALRSNIEARMQDARLQGKLNSFDEQMSFMSSPAMLTLRDQLLANDVANTVYVDDVLRNYGWITKARFGEEVQLAAFNMVRFGGNLRIMRSVLPALREELKDAPELGYLYSLLYDSTQLSLGQKQLYGTLLLPDMDGRMRMRRVAQRSTLDARREAMGLPPIREFLANFEQQFGRIQIED